MNGPAILFLLVTAMALLMLPARWATLPLIAGATYMTMGQQVEVGVFHFTILRLLILVGLLRMLMRGERPAGGFNGMDRLMLIWGGWALVAGFFHENPSAAVIYRLGVVYNTLGCYFLIRCFCNSLEDVTELLPSIALLLVPVALAMVYEQLTHKNLFAVFGGVGEEPIVRSDRLRSQGPFRHPILAGTVGAICVPLLLGVWRQHQWKVILGLAACLTVAVTSASSGPLLTIMAGLFALSVWRWRRFTPHMRVAAVLGYVLLELLMKDPAYFILRRIDLTGSSASYHRPAIIQASIHHLWEWWLAGTDYTRHWMPYGVSWSEDHSDITNHYLAQGVRGGLPQMFLFIAVLWCGFYYVGKLLRRLLDQDSGGGFVVWALGACLFAHATTCISVAYFDQSVVFLYLPLAMISSVYAVTNETATSSVTERQMAQSLSEFSVFPR